MKKKMVMIGFMLLTQGYAQESGLATENYIMNLENTANAQAMAEQIGSGQMINRRQQALAPDQADYLRKLLIAQNAEKNAYLKSLVELDQKIKMKFLTE